MPELVKDEKDFEPIYLVLKTRKEFDYLLGLVTADPLTQKENCKHYDGKVNKDFENCLVYHKEKNLK